MFSHLMINIFTSHQNATSSPILNAFKLENFRGNDLFFQTTNNHVSIFVIFMQWEDYQLLRLMQKQYLHFEMWKEKRLGNLYLVIRVYAPNQRYRLSLNDWCGVLW